MFETHGDRKFWHVFCRKLPKAAKFGVWGVSEILPLSVRRNMKVKHNVSSKYTET